MMSSHKYRLIRFGFDALHRTRLYRIAEPFTRGRGVILTLHHVRPRVEKAFAPCELLEITPEFLDATITTLLAKGYQIIPLSEVPTRLRRPEAPPFAVLTFDDGYRDNAVHAAPVLKRHGVPFTVFVTSGFAERAANLWWLDLEKIVAKADRIHCRIAATELDLRAVTVEQKRAAFIAIYWTLRRASEAELQSVMRGLCAAHGVDPAATVGELCMSWSEIAAFSADTGAAIGAHTLTHPMLATMDAIRMRGEIIESRQAIDAALKLRVSTFAYPFGDSAAAGPREFDTVRQAGFDIAVTTRPGLVFDGHLGHLTALPRMSVNGMFQRISDLDVLLSGLPFAAFNRGQKLNVA